MIGNRNDRKVRVAVDKSGHQEAARCERREASDAAGAQIVGKGGCQRIVFGNRDRQQFTFASGLHRMNDSHRHHVVAIISEIGVKDQRNRLFWNRWEFEHWFLQLNVD